MLQRHRHKNVWTIAGVCLAVMLVLTGCDSGSPADKSIPLRVPGGYAAVLKIMHDGRLLHFGPFVGYYFKPKDPADLTRLEFLCFNERRFYTLDQPENALLFDGEAVMAELVHHSGLIPASGGRIRPVFFADAPEDWKASRPSPQGAFVHFHSCYNAAGPVFTGFWLRHNARAAFTYDMGGRVEPGSPLYHDVQPGPDGRFAAVIEFDTGPGKKGE